MSKPHKTHFGYQEVPLEEKAKKVAGVFHSVAHQYDVMNDVMSLGLHRLWKSFAVQMASVKSGAKVLDVAGGSGDLTARLVKRVGKQGHVYLADINRSMLARGRDRLIDRGHFEGVTYVQADAECLPFVENYFDCVTIAFGLRNVTDQLAALRSMYHVLKPGGKCLVLEFSKPYLKSLEKAYDLYSFYILPQLGHWIAGDKASYQYLVESIRMHPNQEQLVMLMTQAGFDECSYQQLCGGIVALHTAYKF